MKLYLFLAITSSCILVVVTQGEVCTGDISKDACSLVTAAIAAACYTRDRGPDVPSIFGMCCETCRTFIDPLALPGCEYGDRSFSCSESNCSVPNRQDTKLCCKTCRASIEAEMNLSANMTTSATTGTTTSTTETTSNQPAVQATTVSTTTTEPSTAETTTLPTMTTESTTTTTEVSTETMAASVTTSMSTTTTSTAPPTTTRAPPTTTSTINAPTTAQSTTTTSTSTIIGSATTPITATNAAVATQANSTGVAQTRTISNINPSSSTNLGLTRFCKKIPNVCSLVGFRVICYNYCGGVERAANDCKDKTKCDNLRPAQCYSNSVRDVCCAKCKAIKQSISDGCPYGDKYPIWCRLKFARTPQYVCRVHRDNCCYTCRNPVVNTRKTSLSRKSGKSFWRKWVKSQKKKRGRKDRKNSRKGSRKGRKRKSKRRRERDN